MAIIQIENVSKKYWIHHQRRGDSLKEALSTGVKKKLHGWFRPSELKQSAPDKEEFWALKDLSLDIEEGDRIALLGRNGAGKSTLLKILSRITEPTKGRVKIGGRVTSLLEVGTGFHPDLTGRENILLNGAIMGMSYKEIRQKFDEIVAFADIEKFLDTPLKRYSSGMFMRLGFAVAAHLDSEIMIVDEVLAVGDAQFQQKCLKKMNEIGAQHRTILFVSHNVNSVLALCNKGVFLEKGELRAFESIDQCVSRYIRGCPDAGLNWKGNVGDEHFRMMEASLRAPSSDASFYIHGEKTHLNLAFEVLKPHSDLLIGFTVLNAHNQPIASTRLSDHKGCSHVGAMPGLHQASCEIDLNLFHPGEYQIRMEAALLNQKKILEGEVLLKFAVYTQDKTTRHEAGSEKEGISLGNRWQIHS